ncbi:hypothetical protein [Moumouvirus maliensis]|nr:hypothetical protein [Moumouvirus maliensis]
MNIIPFGKYKGKYYNILLKDKQYAKWMIENTDIKNDYPNLYKYINIFLNVKSNKMLFDEILTYLNKNIIKIDTNNEIDKHIKKLYNDHINKLIIQVKEKY